LLLFGCVQTSSTPENAKLILVASLGDQSLELFEDISQMKKKTIIVSQDEKLRHALEFLLNTEPSVWITGSIQSYTGLLAVANVTCPDLVLMDWDVSDQSGTEVIAALQQINPETRTIVFSHAKTEQAARSAGADICITKGSSPDEILKNFRALW
jgi:DNA-binding NarL/FixJ family response regulator